MQFIDRTGKQADHAIYESADNDTVELDSGRDYSFDYIKAFLIFSVVYAHYIRMSATFDISTVGGVIYLTSFSYIMQGFLFVAGYFSRNTEKCRKTAFQTFLFPYLLLMPLMFLLRYLLFGEAHLDMTHPTMALWYLLTMFYYRFLLKDLVRIKWILPISVAVSLLAGLIPALDVTFSLGRTFAFLPFFLLGYYCKAEYIQKIRKMPKMISAILLIFLMGFVIYVAYSKAIPVTAFHMKASYSSVGLDNLTGMAVRILLSIAALAWIFIMINLAPKKKTSLVLIGQNTMIIYLLHIIVRYGIKANKELFGQNAASYLLLLMIALVSLWAFSRPVVVKGYKICMDGLYSTIFNLPKMILHGMKKLFLKAST